MDHLRTYFEPYFNHSLIEPNLNLLKNKQHCFVRKSLKIYHCGALTTTSIGYHDMNSCHYSQHVQVQVQEGGSLTLNKKSHNQFKITNISTFELRGKSAKNCPPTTRILSGKSIECFRKQYRQTRNLITKIVGIFLLLLRKHALTRLLAHWPKVAISSRNPYFEFSRENKLIQKLPIWA